MHEQGPQVSDPAEPIVHSRRSLLLRCLAALFVAGVAMGADRLILANDNERNTFGARVISRSIDSRLLDRSLPYRVVIPKRAPSSGRKMLVFLHGRGEDERSYLDEEMFEALSEQAGRAPLVAFPSAARTSYWHDREGGAWGSYVLDEVIPEIAERFDVKPNRVAIGGISMGGFGAYDLARLAPGEFCAVGGHSPALWESASETADGAFDDAEDFSRHDVIGAASADPNPYAGTKVWLDAGDDDPFRAGHEAFVEGLRANGVRPIVRSSSGGHDDEYWRGNWSEYMAFYAARLKRCEIPNPARVEEAETDVERPGTEPDAEIDPPAGERPRDDPP